MNATYRLQLRPGFGFAEVERLVPYFKRLGISHLYLSPIMEARRGSTHGYDVVDHNRFREELGGEAGFEALLAACVATGLSLIIDFVPNHAGVGPHNESWQDVLAYGRNSPFANYFDIDWDPLKAELKDKLLLPFLGRPYGEALDSGELSLCFERDRLFACYYTERFALRPESYGRMLEEMLPALERDERYWDVMELLNAYRSLGPAERERAEALRQRFAELSQRLPLLDVLDGIRGEKLHALLESQRWRLSSWKTAGYEINYRRFFDINDLVALRMELPEVFFDTHRLLGRLVRRDGVEGVRIDHIDGLLAPLHYLKRLRELGAKRIWVEKILGPGEVLPPDWPVEGTTGYEVLSDLVRVLNWPGGEQPLDQAYRRYVGHPRPWSDVVHTSKLLVMSSTLSGELFRLAYGLNRLSEADYRTRDFTLEALREALAQLIAAFPRYRTYMPEYPDQAAEILKTSAREAFRRTPVFEPSVYDFILRVILGQLAPELQEEQLRWVARFQGYTAPVAAKGVEDTAFYRYHRLVALNNVGSEPDRFSLQPEAFHSRARFRALRYPSTLVATATHDHKRGEDLRMRLIVLSELHGVWASTLRGLARIARRHWGQRGPSNADAVLFYQTIAALWDSAPLQELEERLTAYMEKSAREAKTHTTWLNPDTEYEAALDRFVRGMLRDKRLPRVLAPLAAALVQYGFINTISQLVLKICTAGVPDFYQGCELLDLSLVDPDNRRPVNYDRRARLLDELEPMLATPDLKRLNEWRQAANPELKMYVTARLLRLRAAHKALFAGTYHELSIAGEAEQHALGFAREGGGERFVAVVVRFPALLEGRGGYGDTRVTLPGPGPWVEALSGRTVESHDGALKLADLPLPWGVLCRFTGEGAPPQLSSVAPR